VINRKQAQASAERQFIFSPVGGVEVAKVTAYKYPDLIPYESVVDAVALKLKASGYKGESREAVMETFANEARKEILAESGGNVGGSGSEQSTGQQQAASAPEVQPIPSADGTLAMLKVGDKVFYNVTVTTVTPAKIYFTYSGGTDSAKLKDLSPALQKYYNFNPTNAANFERK
jgi:hypothetical protein